MKRILGALSLFLFAVFTQSVGILIFDKTEVSASPNTTCSLLNDQVLIAESSGNIIRYNINTLSTIDATFTSTPGLPHEMIIHKDATELWIANGSEIERVNLTTGASIGSIVLGASAYGMTMGPDGDAYVLTDDVAVLRVDSDSPFTVSTFVSAGSGGLGTLEVGGLGLEFGPDGNLYAVSSRDDAGTDRSVVKRYNGTTGAYIGDFTPEQSATNLTAFHVGWQDMKFHTDGYLYVASYGEGVKRFDSSTGAYIDVYGTTDGTDYTMQFTDEGDLLVGNFGGGTVDRFTAQSTSTSIFTGTPGTLKTVYLVPPTCFDWGDAADSGAIGAGTYTHPVTNADNAARHLIQVNTRGGVLEDQETDGQPTADADGDDATDDEDGTTFSSTLVAPSTLINATFTAYDHGVATPQDCMGYLNVWVDINGDGDWSDLGEQVVDDQFLGTACDHDFTFTPTATDGPVMVRTRYSNLAGITTTGAAPDGEVEDYAIGITGLTPASYSLGNRVWLDDGSGGGTRDDGVQNGTEAGIAGATVNLYEDNDVNGTPDGAAVDTATTDASGYYRFDNLAAGSYLVGVVATSIPDGYASSTGQSVVSTPDMNDHADDTPVSGLWLSHTVDLGTSDPTDETDIAGVGAGAESPHGDANSNLAIDFGFVIVADLGIVKTVTPAIYTLGASTDVDYTLTVTNYGPADVVGASVTDTAPSNVTFGAWTCTVSTGTGACGAASGTGNISTTVDLDMGATATYAINAVVGSAATGTITNTATVTLPSDIEQDPSSNQPDSDSVDITPQVPNPSMIIVKTSYLGHTSGADCPGVDPLVIVDPEHTAQNVTFCFVLTNNGDTYLDDVSMTDTPLGIDQTDMTLLSGTFPLAPGQSATYYYQTALSQGLTNTVCSTVTPVESNGTPTGEPDVDACDPSAVVVYVYDPPIGIKTGTVTNNNTRIHWDMTWINNSDNVADNVEITDEPPVGTAYLAGSLLCTPTGSTTVASCTFEDPSTNFPRGRVIVIATIENDPGATTAAAASNELVISFDTTINSPGTTASFLNQGTLTWDADDDGNDDFTVVTDDPATTPSLDPTTVQITTAMLQETGSPLWIFSVASLLLVAMAVRVGFRRPTYRLER